MKKLFFLLVVGLFAGMAFKILTQKTAAADSIPIEHEYETKIVYTTNALFNQDVLKSDCANRGGFFSECGSICDEINAETTACPSVCAFTCTWQYNLDNAASTNIED